MTSKKIILWLAITSIFLLGSCTGEDTPCTETICPDGFNNCFEKPCVY